MVIFVFLKISLFMLFCGSAEEFHYIEKAFLCRSLPLALKDFVVNIIGNSSTINNAYIDYLFSLYFGYK